MNLFETSAYAAEASGAPQDAGMINLLFLGGFILIFYFLLWRPQSKRRKEHQSLIGGLAKGDQDFWGVTACTISANSTGSGARLTGSGSASYSANDLVLTAEGFPAGESGLFFMGGSTFSPVDVGDGLGCTGGLFRFLPIYTLVAGAIGFAIGWIVGKNV